MRRFLVLIVVMVFFIIGLSFHLKNDQRVILNYYVGTIEAYFSVFIITSAIVGVVLGIVSTLPTLFRLKRKNRHLLHQMQITEKEVKNLRSLPIKDSL